MNGGIMIFVRCHEVSVKIQSVFPNVRQNVLPHSEQHPITISSLKGRFLALGF